MIINSNTLKHLRKRQSMSQADLAMATQVSISTVKRIESSKSDYESNPRVAKKLADILGVKPEDLSKEVKDLTQDEEELRNLGYRTLKTMIDRETALSYQAVAHMYGISIRSQIVMAPLFAALLAEGSLTWRQKKLDEIDEATDKLIEQAAGHLSFTSAADRIESAAAEEQTSIDNRDVFGSEVADDTFDLGFDPSTNNPLADYLRELASDIGSDNIEVDPDEIGYWRTHEGMPEYSIGTALIEQISGCDKLAEFSLKRGYAQIHNIPENLTSDDMLKARIEWLAEKIPPAVRKEREAIYKEEEAIYKELEQELYGEDPCDQPTKGQDHAS